MPATRLSALGSRLSALGAPGTQPVWRYGSSASGRIDDAAPQGWREHSARHSALGTQHSALGGLSAGLTPSIAALGTRQSALGTRGTLFAGLAPSIAVEVYEEVEQPDGPRTIVTVY